MEVHEPSTAAALHRLGLLSSEDLPGLAAHWLVGGAGGPHVADLAGRSRRDPDVAEVWPLALAELGVPWPLTGVRRTAIGWMATQVTAGGLPVRWLVRGLWPARWSDDDPDPQIDDLAWTLDDLGEWAVPIVAGATVRRGEPTDEHRRAHAEHGVRQMHVALAALSRGDVDAALAALSAPP